MKRRADIPINSTASLMPLLARATPAQRADAFAMLQHYTREFTRMQRSGKVNPESMAASVHALVDEHIDRMMATDPNAPNITCRRGCGHCCHLQVSIDPHEATLLVLYAAEQGIEIDRERLQRQVAHNATTWRYMPRADQRCVFLSPDNECRVYEHRPNACRKYQVVTDPELCDTDKHPGHTVGILCSGVAEIVASAALQAFAPAGPMPRMLLKVIK